MKKKIGLLIVAIILILTAGSALGSIRSYFEGYPVVKIYVDGKEVISDVPAVILNGRTMVPVRFISEELEAEVVWDADEYAVYIYSDGLPTVIDPSTKPEPEPSESRDLFKIGETVEMGDFLITVNGARWGKGDRYYSPSVGERWLIIDCTLENKGSKPYMISTLLMLNLYDENHYSLDQKVFVSDLKGDIGGELHPGRRKRGEVAYSTEAGQSEWMFTFEPFVFGFGQVAYLINADDVN